MDSAKLAGAKIVLGTDRVHCWSTALHRVHTSRSAAAQQLDMHSMLVHHALQQWQRNKCYVQGRAGDAEAVLRARAAGQHVLAGGSDMVGRQD